MEEQSSPPPNTPNDDVYNQLATVNNSQEVPSERFMRDDVFESKVATQLRADETKQESQNPYSQSKSLASDTNLLMAQCEDRVTLAADRSPKRK